MKDVERKVTVEDLLRLKRAERPAPEFWARFESEMRAKQLAAIVVRRPVWDGFSRIFSVVYRNQLPFGAAAALALTWVGLHYSAAPSLVVAEVPARPAEPVAATPAPALAAPAAVQVAVPQEKVQSGIGEVAETIPSQKAAVVSKPSHLMKAPEASQPESLYRTPFADGIAISLADFRATESDLAKRDVFGTDREFEAVVSSGRQPAVDPLARVDPAGERLERLLAPALPAYSSSGAQALTGDRMKQKAADERMYESMDRYGAGGMSLEFRF